MWILFYSFECLYDIKMDFNLFVWEYNGSLVVDWFFMVFDNMC